MSVIDVAANSRDHAALTADIDGQQITIDVVYVTPDLAAELLRGNTRNRNIRPARVAAYAEAMTAGAWYFLADPIRIAADGTTLDGQHRLRGVVDSGCPQWMIIARGIPPEWQMAMDKGTKRTTGDNLKMRGEANATQIAAALRELYFVKRSGGKFGVGKGAGAIAPSDDTIAALLVEHQGIRGCIPLAGLVSGATLLSGTTAMVLIYLFRAINRRDADVFMTKLHTGLELKERDPIYALRKAIIRKGRVGPVRRDQFYWAAVTIKGFNAWREGREVSMIAWRPGGSAPEPFPRVAILPSDQPEFWVEQMLALPAR